MVSSFDAAYRHGPTVNSPKERGKYSQYRRMCNVIVALSSLLTMGDDDAISADRII